MPAPFPPIRVFLFDLDDTLNDRALSWMKFVERLMHPTEGQLGHCVAADVHRAILAADRGGYRPREDFIGDLIDTLPWRVRPSAADLETFWRAEFPKCMVARDAAVDLLKRLRFDGYRLGIVTNGRAATQQAKMDFLGLTDLVDAVIISESVGVKKPDPQIFGITLAVLSASAGETLFVGDDPDRDIVGAARAGMRTVWVENGRSWPDGLKRADCSIGGFAALAMR